MIETDALYCNLEKIADSGQVLYGWEKNPDGSYTITSRDKRARAYYQGDKVVIDCSPEDEAYFSHYFDLETDYKAIEKGVLKKDKFLSQALEYGRGIRILNQDLWETVVSFIVSQNNNIPRIQGSLKKLKADDDFFPDHMRLLENKDRIYNAGLGYRDNYLIKISEELAAGVRELSFSDDLETAYKELISITGIGPKVANCILLFGLHHMECCPVDTWIKKIFEKYYNGQPASWAKNKYAGFYQQLAFYYERSRA